MKNVKHLHQSGLFCLDSRFTIRSLLHMCFYYRDPMEQMSISWRKILPQESATSFMTVLLAAAMVRWLIFPRLWSHMFKTSCQAAAV